jgi:catechol 2,3-dioxygenase-like lactoylglutathione lyase family enzyme
VPPWLIVDSLRQPRENKRDDGSDYIGGTVTLSVSHFGICVSDLEGSLRFYRDGLGFKQVASHQVGEEFGALMEVEGVKLESRMLSRDGITIELLGFESPGHTGDGRRRPMNQLGLTHLSLRVDDVEGVASTIEAMGGSVVRGTRTTFDLSGTRLDFLYCTDPDGVRIELMDLPG